MTYEYMVQLHKFLYQSNDSDVKRLLENVRTHLKFIPHRKLYRYRKCNDRELQILQDNSVWLSDPQRFPDMFDATIPMADRRYVNFEYSFCFYTEISYQALLKTLEDDEEAPSKDDFANAILTTMLSNSPAEISEKMVDIFGKEEYEKMRSSKLPSIDLSKHIKRTSDFLDYLSSYPRKTLAIASFTTRYDNRNMWENYAENYSGFCVEYDFSHVISELSTTNSWDVFHLLPVKYYKKRPLFDYTDLVQRIVQSDMDLQESNINNIDEFLYQYYRSITAKVYDYRAEQEWRLIMERKNLGKYSFPYASKLYIGKNMSDENILHVRHISKKLDVPVFAQTLSPDGNTFIYKPI